MNQIATLVSGEKVALASVQQNLMHLEMMANTVGVMPLYELRELCKDPDHKPFGTTGDDMERFGFLQQWDPHTKRAVIHDAVRAIILAAVQGEDLNLMINPQIVASID